MGMRVWGTSRLDTASSVLLGAPSWLDTASSVLVCTPAWLATANNVLEGAPVWLDTAIGLLVGASAGWIQPVACLYCRCDSRLDTASGLFVREPAG
jgi:hypothetical protein